MVSTRSVKHKFSEGEKVLCYEPDPAKTKVLYNSKVLDISVKKDNNGKKTVRFLIHFQGWNSTWDRFVTEDFILKDTEENRRLQKELAEKAQLTSGGNLYRRGRKKRTLSRTGSENERRGGGESDSDGENSGGNSNVHISVSPVIQAILELDHLLITKQNKLLKIPAYPNAVEILEMYMKEFTISQVRLMCHRRGHLRPTAGKNAHITVYEIYSRVNLCHEIADGLRVYLDFMTDVALLYRSEKAQYKDSVSKPRVLRNLKKEDNKKTEAKENMDLKRNSPVKETERRKSLRSHTEPSNSSSVATSSSHHFSHPEIKTVNSSNLSRDVPCTTTQDCNSIAGRDNSLEIEHLVLRPMSNREKDLIRRLVNRKVVPEAFLNQQYSSEVTSIAPCMLYGATHLARALVKIPDIFPHAEHPESRINLINEYLSGFSKFLEGHPEWFGEHTYCDNPYADTTAGGS